MIYSRCIFLTIPAVIVIFLSTSVESYTDYKLCPRGNITILNSINHNWLVTPDRCFPTPIIDRNQMQMKPEVQFMIARPGLPIRYTILMVEVNKTYDSYNVHWMETNLTVNNQHMVIQNQSQYRDVRKMIEYRPPKMSPMNITYHILLYQQTTFPVHLPQTPFKPKVWSAISHLTLVGGVEFIIRGNNKTNVGGQRPINSHPFSPPIPPLMVPIGGGGGGVSGNANQMYNQHPPPVTYNQTLYGRNITNHTHYYPPGTHYHPQPVPHQPNRFYPPSHTGHRRRNAASVNSVAAFHLIAITTFVLAIFHL